MVRLPIDSNPFRSMLISHPPRIQLFQNFTLNIKGQGQGHSSRSNSGFNIRSTHFRFTSLSFHVNRSSYYCDTAFSHLTCKIRGQGHKPTMLHNYRLRQFHRTLIGVNPSSGFRDMFSQVRKPNGSWFYKCLVHGQGHMGQMGKLIWRFTSTGLNNSIKLWMD